jgi:hypothetical protein
MDDRPTDAERDAHATLRRMEPADQVVALVSAIVNAERDVFAQVGSLIDVLQLMGTFLDNDEREYLAHRLVDAAVKMVCRWH